MSGDINGDEQSIGAVYSVNSKSLTYLYDIASQSNDFGQTVNFSHNGELLLIGTIDLIIPTVYVYSVNGTEINYIKKLSAQGQDNFYFSAEFSADDRLLVCGAEIYNNYIGNLAQIQCIGTAEITILATKSTLTVKSTYKRI